MESQAEQEIFQVDELQDKLRGVTKDGTSPATMKDFRVILESREVKARELERQHSAPSEHFRPKVMIS